MNLYAYVGNDPLNMVDPTGMWGQNFVNDSDRTVQIFGYKNVADANKNGPTDVANVAKNTAVTTLRGTADIASAGSNGALSVATATAAVGQMEIAGPASAVSTGLGIVAGVADATADLIESGSVSGETAQNASPMMAGQATQTVLSSATKMAPGLIKGTAIAVEAAATVVETVLDEEK